MPGLMALKKIVGSGLAYRPAALSVAYRLPLGAYASCNESAKNAGPVPTLRMLSWTTQNWPVGVR